MVICLLRVDAEGKAGGTNELLQRASEAKIPALEIRVGVVDGRPVCQNYWHVDGTNKPPSIPKPLTKVRFARSGDALPSSEEYCVSLKKLVAGATCEDVRSRLSNRFEKPFSDLMRFRPEIIWYWGLDGVTEREQFVITHGRAIAFVHVHRYGNDLYVAWDGHLNRGQWVEKDLYQGVDKRSGRLAVIRVVEAGYQRLTEYDLTDANSLMEWVHAQVVQVIKQIMVEQKIDQEIDFKVIRGERQGVTSGEGSARETIGRIADKAKNMLKRVG